MLYVFQHYTEAQAEAMAEEQCWWHLLSREYNKSGGILDDFMLINHSYLRHRAYTQNGNIRWERYHLGVGWGGGPIDWENVLQSTVDWGWFVAAEDKYWYKEYYNEEDDPGVLSLPEEYQNKVMGHIKYAADDNNSDFAPVKMEETGWWLWGCWDPPAEGEKIVFYEGNLGVADYKIFGWQRKQYYPDEEPLGYIPLIVRDDEE